MKDELLRNTAVRARCRHDIIADHRSLVCRETYPATTGSHRVGISTSTQGDARASMETWPRSAGHRSDGRRALDGATPTVLPGAVVERRAGGNARHCCCNPSRRRLASLARNEAQHQVCTRHWRYHDLVASYHHEID